MCCSRRHRRRRGLGRRRLLSAVAGRPAAAAAATAAAARVRLGAAGRGGGGGAACEADDGVVAAAAAPVEAGRAHQRLPAVAAGRPFPTPDSHIRVRTPYPVPRQRPSPLPSPPALSTRPPPCRLAAPRLACRHGAAAAAAGCNQSQRVASGRCLDAASGGGGAVGVQLWDGRIGACQKRLRSRAASAQRDRATEMSVLPGEAFRSALPVMMIF